MNTVACDKSVLQLTNTQANQTCLQVTLRALVGTLLEVPEERNRW